MPPMEANSDEWIASVASYVRYTFGAATRAQARLSPVVRPEEVKSSGLNMQAEQMPGLYLNW